MEEQDYIAFENYLTGKLTAEETQAFEKKLSTNPNFNKSFNTYKELSGFLKHKFEEEEETKAFKLNIETIANKHFNKTKTVPKTSTILKYLVAACVVLMFGIFTFNITSNPTYSDYNNHEPMTVVRSTTKTTQEATKAFNSKNYKQANVLLRKVLEGNPKNSEYQLYYAISNIELGNYEISDNYLKKLSEGNSVFKNKAIWYLALSKLKQNRTDETLLFLKQIPEQAEDYKQAQKLINKLE